MIHPVITGDAVPFLWLDVIEPTREELTELATLYGLHRTSVEDSLEPEHLPKHELLAGDGEPGGETLFIVVRAFDEAARHDCFTPQQMTRKLALFIGNKVLLTIHRQDLAFVRKARETWSGRQIKPASLAHIVNDLLRGVVDSYDKPIAKLLEGQTALESQTFRHDSGTPSNKDTVLADGYFVRRRASIYSYMLSLTSDIVPNLMHWPRFPKASHPFFRDLKDKCDRLAFYADDIRDNVDNILNLHLALAAQTTNAASHRTNEVMRLLTVFSAFFLPLNFIASIYGMNFDYMPELRRPFGYHATLLVMAGVATGIFLWFKRKGWLRN